MSRANGEGTIYRRGDRWEGQAFVRGVRVTRSGRTRAVVAQRLKDAKGPTDSPGTVEALSRLWLTDLLPQEGLTDRTVEWYRFQTARYVLPYVGKHKLADLSVAHVERMAATLVESGLSRRTAMTARTCLGKMLRAAERRGWVSRNVAYLATPPRDQGRAREIKALDSASVRKMLDALEGTLWQPIALLGVSTGLRPGELLALHWADLRDGHVTVRHSAVILPGGGVGLKAPKRQRSYRTVPVPPSVLTALDGLPRLGSLVFPAPDGGLRRTDSYRAALHKAAGVHPHQLRHTYATHLLEAGTPIHHVAELLGDTVPVVEAAYSHVLRPKTEVAALVEGLLGA